MDVLWAKSDGETLLEHTSHVMAIADRLCQSLPFSAEQRIEIGESLRRIAALHDLGKGATGFQAALRVSSGKGKWGRRHEILSTAYATLWVPSLSAPELLAIITHHCNLPEGAVSTQGERPLPENELPYEGYAEWRQMKAEFEGNREAIEWFCDEMKAAHSVQWSPIWETPEDFGVLQENWIRRDSQPRHADAQQRRHASLLRGILISSDHMASGHIAPKRAGVVPILAHYERRVYRHELRGQTLLPFQKKCGQRSGNVILKAPTGSGKTLAIFLWAAHNQSMNGRFYYVLPHTASLNAMHQRLRRIYGVRHCGILHSKNAAYLFRLLEGDDISLNVQARIGKAKSAKNLGRLAREMYFPIRATTPHQLLRGALKGQGWELSLSEFPNGCFIFDEIHAFEPKLFGLTIAMAKWLQSMGAKILFASATLPKFAENRLRRHLKVPTDNIVIPNPNDELDVTVLDKKRHEIRIEPGNLLNYLPKIIGRLKTSEKSALIVCNHVRTSQSVFRLLNETFPSPNDELGKRVMLLHARFNSQDRNRIEKAITGKNAPRILVATQAVEVSLDLDYDCGFIEPAPIDALGQRFGRINRKGNAPKPALITIFEEASGGELYDEVLTALTVKELQKIKVLSEQDLTNIVTKVYAHGYPSKARQLYKQGLKNTSLQDFDKDIVAGTHYAWLENLMEKSDGQVEILPHLCAMETGDVIDMTALYAELIKEHRYLEAKQLLVPVRIGQFFSLKNKEALMFNKKLKEWVTIQNYSTLTGLDLDNETETTL